MNQKVMGSDPISRAITMGMWLLIFLAPLKWGLPILEPDKIPLPETMAEWLMGSWPPQVFCFAVYFLFFLQSLLWILRGEVSVPASKLPFTGPLIFLAACAISNIFSVYPGQGFCLLLQYTAYVLLFFLLLSRSDDIGSLANALAVSAGIVALYGIFQRYAGFDQTVQWTAEHYADSPQWNQMQSKLQSGRIFSTLVYPNSLGGFLLATIPLTVWAWIVALRRGPVAFGMLIASVYAGSLAILWMNGLTILTREGMVWHGGFLLASLFFPASAIGAVFLTGSQGTFAVLAILACVVFFIWVRGRPIHYRIMAALLVLLLLVALALDEPRLAALIKWDTLIFRWGYWISALLMALSRWWIGYGPGSFGVVYPAFKLDWVGETQFAHNDVLQMAAEIGLVGAAGWLLWWLGWINRHCEEAGGRRNNPVEIASSRLNTAGTRNDTLLPGGLRIAAIFGLAGFLLHSLLDFDWQIPAIAICAVLLASVLYRSSFDRKIISLPKVPWVCAGAAVFIAVILVILPYRYFYRCARGQAQFHWGIALAEQGRWREAQQALANAIRFDERIPAYHFFHGMIFEKLGNIPDALRAYGKATRLAPTVSYYWYRLGVLARDTDEVLVKHAFAQAHRYYPSNQQYKIYLPPLAGEG